MDIALLNQRITIQKSTVSADSIGNRILTWTTYHSCFATMSGEGSGERDGQPTTVDHTTCDFTVRYCSALNSITPDGYRVLFRSEFYDIEGIDHMNFKHKCLKLKCRKVER